MPQWDVQGDIFSSAVVEVQVPSRLQLRCVYFKQTASLATLTVTYETGKQQGNTGQQSAGLSHIAGDASIASMSCSWLRTGTGGQPEGS